VLEFHPPLLAVLFNELVAADQAPIQREPAVLRPAEVGQAVKLVSRAQQETPTQAVVAAAAKVSAQVAHQAKEARA